MKAENADNDAMVDDVAGQAYIEQFGLETFQRADNAVRANRASRYYNDMSIALENIPELIVTQTNRGHFSGRRDISRITPDLGSA